MTDTALPNEDAANTAVHALTIDLLDKAIAGCCAEDVDSCHDWEDVVALLDWAAVKSSGEPLRVHLRQILEQAGFDLPVRSDGPNLVIERVVLQATEVACERLGEIRATTPLSFDEASRRVAARLQNERASARRCPCFIHLLRAAAAGDAETVEAYAAVSDDMSVPRLVQLGVVVLRDGFPAEPETEAEHAAALAQLEHRLFEEVSDRVASYNHPVRGRIQLRQVTLSPAQQAEVRRAAAVLLGEKV